jgi:hypothetical protein
VTNESGKKRAPRSLAELFFLLRVLLVRGIGEGLPVLYLDLQPSTELHGVGEDSRHAGFADSAKISPTSTPRRARHHHIFACYLRRNLTNPHATEVPHARMPQSVPQHFVSNRNLIRLVFGEKLRLGPLSPNAIKEEWYGTGRNGKATQAARWIIRK